MTNPSRATQTGKHAVNAGADLVSGEFNQAVEQRFGQLTYSSFDEGTGIGGGWQVKETAGGLSEAEADILRFWVHTIFELVTPLPAFPTPEEVADFPRRLMYALLEDGRAGYWHTAPAGVDGSGRPGNVFAHCVLDRDPASPTPPRRPIELWRSPGWLTPYGPSDVAAATLDSDALPPEAQRLDRNAVIAFLCDQDVWRLGVLSVLLDAVAGAAGGGQKVVLGTKSADNAALWIGAVSHLMSAGASRAFGWSTFDRASDVTGSVGRGLHLIAVPSTDLAAMAARDDLVLLDEDEMPAMGDLGGEPHRTASGSEIPVTEWSVIAQAVLVDAVSARAVLEIQDEVAAAISDTGLHASWPLAMAVSLSPDLHEDVGGEAATVIAQYSPERLARHPDLFGAASFLIDRMLGSSAEDCWSRLRSVPAPGRDGYAVTVELMMTVYLERALRDGDWLLQTGGVPFPAVRPRDGWMPARLAAQVAVSIDEMFDRARGSGEVTPEFALYALRVIDLLVRANCIGGIGKNVVAGGHGALTVSPLVTCQNILEAVLVPVIFDAVAGPAFVGQFGDLDPVTSKVVVVDVIGSAPLLSRGTLGRRLPETVLAWLVPANLLPPDSDFLADLPRGTDVAMGAVAAELAYQKLASQVSHRAWSRFSFLVLWRVLEQANNPDVAPPVLDPIFRSPLEIGPLEKLLRQHPGSVPPRFLTRTLITGAGSEALRNLCGAVYSDLKPDRDPPLAPSDPGDEIAFAVAAFRIRSEWETMSRDERLVLQSRFLDSALRESLRHRIGNLPADLVHSLAVVGVSRAIESPGEAGTLDLVKMAVRAADRADRKQLVKAIADLVRPDGLNVSWLVESSIVGAEDGPDTRLASGAERFLASLTRETQDRERSLLDEVIDLLLNQGRYEGPVDVESIDELLRPRIEKAGPRKADKIRAVYRKSAKKWIDERGLGSGGMISRLRRK